MMDDVFPNVFLLHIVQRYIYRDYAIIFIIYLMT